MSIRERMNIFDREDYPELLNKRISGPAEAIITDRILAKDLCDANKSVDEIFSIYNNLIAPDCAKIMKEMGLDKQDIETITFLLLFSFSQAMIGLKNNKVSNAEILKNVIDSIAYLTLTI